jgi:DNA-binding Xre family transcriptional regulator
MKKSDLFSILSSETVSRITKGGDVTTQTINRICAWLDVQPGDIMEYIPEENENGDKL